MVVAIAHRGDPLNERENTFAAFAAAVELGADWIELDLQRAKDGRIVILHDPTLLRLWGREEAVADLDVEELRSIGLPTLAEALETIPLPIMVDVTGPDVVEGAVQDIQAAGAMERCLFVTGDMRALRQLRSLANEARIGMTWVLPTVPKPALIAELRAECWNPAYQFITAERVAEMHAAGLSVSTWTVDTGDEIGEMVEAGVDAIVSNQVELLRRTLGP